MASRISAADMDAAIIAYLPLLDNAKKEAVLNILKAFAPVPDAGDHWDDPAFVAEMDRRYEDYNSGKNIASFKDAKSAMHHLRSGIKK